MISGPPTTDEVLALAERNPVIRGFVEAMLGEDVYYRFKPRPDDPASFDEQHSFCFSRDLVSFMVGGNACLVADTIIDNPSGASGIAIGELALHDTGFPVITMTESGANSSCAIGAWRKPKQENLLRIVLSSGREFVGSEQHRVLCSISAGNDQGNRDLRWRRLCDVHVGTSLVSAPSLFERQSALPLSLLSRKHDRHCKRTPLSSLGHCLSERRQRDGRSLSRASICRAHVQQQDDARAHIPASLHGDDLFSVAECTRLCRSYVPLSMIEYQRQTFARHAVHNLVGEAHYLQQPEMVGTFVQGMASKGIAAIARKTKSGPFRMASSLRCATHEDHQGARGIENDACEESFFSEELAAEVQIIAVEPAGQDWVYTCHVPCTNNYRAAGVFHRNSGTTECAAYKTGQFLLYQQPPPRKDTPFWIIAETYDQVMDVCWAEKLQGHGHIPSCEIEWDRIAWHSSKQNRPKNVPLKPWPKEKGGCPTKNWRIEFKSYEQGRQAMQARSIGGFWFSEQFPLDIFLEVLRGCREYMFPGGQFAEFTPVNPDLSIWVEKAMEDQPQGWKFYRCNTAKNVVNLKAGWYEQFFALVPDEMRATRETGALASFEGVIYPSFLPSLHVIPEDQVAIPRGAWHDMATDWGASAEHPHATLFGCRDAVGHWLIFDEYWSNDQSKITKDHVAAILEKCARWGWPIEKYRLAVSEGSMRELSPGQVALPHETVRERERISTTRDGLWGQNYADPSRAGEINEFSKRGIPTQMARNQVYAGINEVRTVLKCHPETGEPGIRISSRCQHLIEELRKYRWKKGRRPESGSILNPQVSSPIPLKRDDDTVDALRYLIFSKAIPASETIGSTKKSISAADRKSVQLVRRQLENALTRSTNGIMPGRKL